MTRTRYRNYVVLKYMYSTFMKAPTTHSSVVVRNLFWNSKIPCYLPEEC